MAGGAQSNDDDGFNEINIVPFVDIALVLLIIFMVTTEFVREDEKDVEKVLPKNVPIQLPKAASAEETNTSLLSIAMNRDGTLFLNGERSTLDAVKARVKELQRDGKTLEAFVAADERLTHGAVLTVVDTLRVLGVGNVGMNTKPMEIE
ncbi:MAG: biopolymer transporter ExbD [Deltaproteobacteria bacterium]|jgi:biopolymer transport protein ExbD|nr:biopolymer transporter ExbD [Deltaproteobacteria bacterium]